MIYVACHNPDCQNVGAAFRADEDNAIPNCAVCGQPMVQIAEPAPLQPPTPLPDVPAEDILAFARVAKAAEIQGALTATDPWVARAWEDGLTELPTARAAYREQLRELLLQAQTSTDPAAIEIPAAPAWVPPKS